MKCQTWVKEASFLFDYVDFKQIESEQFKITEPGKWQYLTQMLTWFHKAFLVRRDQKVLLEPKNTNNVTFSLNDSFIIYIRTPYPLMQKFCSTFANQPMGLRLKIFARSRREKLLQLTMKKHSLWCLGLWLNLPPTQRLLRLFIHFATRSHNSAL